MKNLIIQEIRELINNPEAFSYEYLGEINTCNVLLEISNRVGDKELVDKVLMIKKYNIREQHEYDILDCISEFIRILSKYLCKDICLTLLRNIQSLTECDNFCKYRKAFELVVLLDQITIDKNILKKGDENMNSNMNGLIDKMMSNYMPTTIEDGSVALSMTGEVVIKRKNGDFVRYDVSKEKIVNEMNLVLDNESISKTILLMPVSVISNGDVVRENSIYYYILDAENLKCVNLSTGKKSILVDETNILVGNKIFHKVTSLFSMQNNGTLNPMLMCFMNSDKSEESDLLSTLMMCNMMKNNGINGTNNFMQNPVMMYMLAGKGNSNNDMLKMIMLSQMMGDQGMQFMSPFIQNSNEN